MVAIFNGQKSQVDLDSFCLKHSTHTVHTSITVLPKEINIDQAKEKVKLR